MTQQVGIRYRQEDSWGSNHILVIVNIRYESKIYIKKSNRSSGKTDWDKYKKGVRLRQEEMIENKGYEVMERYNRLCNIMKEEICIATGKVYKKDKEEKDREIKKSKWEG